MRLLRAKRGLSQEALAFECNINRTYLSAIERSERNVSIDNIARIAKGLKVKSWRLLKVIELASELQHPKDSLLTL